MKYTLYQTLAILYREYIEKVVVAGIDYVPEKKTKQHLQKVP